MLARKHKKDKMAPLQAYLQALDIRFLPELIIAMDIGLALRSCPGTPSG